MGSTRTRLELALDLSDGLDAGLVHDLGSDARACAFGRVGG